MNSWDLTKNKYSKWLSNNNLKKEFLNEIKYKGYSLWWSTKFVDRDNVNEEIWYKDLHQILNKKSINKKNINFFYLISKLLLNLVKSITFNILIKFLVKKNHHLEKIDNCFLSQSIGLTDYKNIFIDRRFGKTFSLDKNKNIYLIMLDENINLLKSLFTFKKKLKQIPFKYFITNHYINLSEIFKIHYITLKYFFKIITLSKKRNFFLLGKVDCKYPLKNMLFESFFGSIQTSLIHGEAIGNFIKENRCKNLITYMELLPTARSVYYFCKLANKNINLISINHSMYLNENNLSNYIDKKEFSNSSLKALSPRPDIFMCQGTKFYKQIINIFSKQKVFLIGSFKLELDLFKKKIKNKNLIKANFENKKKKLITIFTSLCDYKSIVEVLNKSILLNFNVILKIHPAKTLKTLEYFKKNFNHNYLLGNRFNNNDLINISDFIIFGDSSVGYQASYLNKNVFRIYHYNFIPTFKINNEIPTAVNEKQVQNFLKKIKIKQNSKKICKDYFYKYDQNATKRLLKVLSNIK